MFPQNPRGAELKRKQALKIITEWMGLFVFPDNPEGAELRRKQALGILAEDEEGKLKELFNKRGREKYYSPLAVSKNMRKYEMLAKANPAMEESYIKKAVYIMVADESYPENAENEKERVLHQWQLDALQVALNDQLGGNIEFKIVPYSMELSLRAKDEGVLFMKLPPAGKGEPRYKTWFSEGRL